MQELDDRLLIKSPTKLSCQPSVRNGGLEPTPVESPSQMDLTTGRKSGSSSDTDGTPMTK